MPRDDRQKAVENRARRHAMAAGFVLQRNPSRTPSAPDYGKYRLATGDSVPSRYTLTLEGVERRLASPKRHPHSWTDPGKRTTRWLTPPHIVEALGPFDLDPCGAPNHHLAARTYVPENGHDGLKLPWEGRVWLNPPYGGEAEPFLRRLVEHGRGTALLFARTDTRFFHETVWDAASAVLFMRGRLSFLHPDGTPSGGSGAASCLVAYGESDASALASSGLPGRIVSL